MKGVPHVIAKKKLVAEYLFLAVKNGLSGDVTQLDTLGIIARGRGRGVRHKPIIGSGRKNSSVGGNGRLYTRETNLMRFSL